MTDKPSRSQTFFNEEGVSGLIHRAFTRAMGYDHDDMKRPLIGICNTYSELNNCNSNLRDISEAVKRGILQAGGLPLEFPTISLGEIYLSPTSMLFRNLAAMDTEEMIRGNPLDGVVLLTNCDKTTPAALMGAASADIPTIMVSGGPMLNGHFRGEVLGACTDCRRYTVEYQAGTIDEATYREAEENLVRSQGHCMVMGTASTMNSLMEALGMALPGNGAIPAVDSRRLRLAEHAGRQIMNLVEQNIKPSDILTKETFDNAIRLLHALGGSTNAIVHLPAIAGRVDVDLPLSRFDELSRTTPMLTNLKPIGEYQMEDLFYAGGIPAVMKQLLPLLNGEVITVTGKPLAENVQSAEIINPDVIHTLDEPLKPEGGLSIVTGNLAPDGAVIKHAAASPHLLHHRGKAIVFNGMDDLKARIHDPDLDVTKDDILVLQNVGPVGGPGMPEVGNIPIPLKLLQQGIRDMVRISDGRMSGTSYGTIVLHVAPESAIGGNLALVQTGDEIELDVENRSIHLHVSDEELAKRREQWKAPKPTFQRGYGQMYLRSVNQAPLGVDFDFLRGSDPAQITEQPKF